MILLAGFALRVAWLACVHPDPVVEGRFDDTAWYRAAAHYFANGDGYVNPFVGTPTAAWPPGYPVFLGTVFRVAGEGVYQTGAANIALALATVVVVYAIALQLTDRRTAIIAAAAMAVWPGQIYFTSLALSEPLFTFLFALAGLLLISASRAGAARGALVVAFGAVVALAALTRGQALVLLPLAIVVWAVAGMYWKRALAWGMLAAFVAGVCIAPWVARNERELGSPVIIATNGGPNLWIGHHEGATGRMQLNGETLPLPERGDMTQPEYEVAADKLALRQGLTYMLTHPLDELRLSVLKLRAIYESDATALDWNAQFRDGYYASDDVELALRRGANGFWLAALALAGVGLLALRSRLRNDEVLFLPLLVLAWTATHLLFFGDARFHYPIAFAVAILGAKGVVAALEALPVLAPGASKKRYAAA